jgi:hypothetical protein
MNGAGVCFQNPFVISNQSRDGNGFWRGEREIVKDAAIGRVVTGCVGPRGIEPLRQSLAGSGMLIFTEAGKCFGSNPAGQANLFRTQAEPLAGNSLTFIIVIANAKMFLKILLCVLQIVLRFGGQHRE